MFTDGITDQQGGENKQKVTTKRFRQWLMEISQLPEAEQGLVWEEKLVAWKGNTRQTDDMLMWRFSV
jgi:serine phosphatase RsbU (regulator of sigma subunit)